MPVTADSVVVELEAPTRQFVQDTEEAARAYDKAMGKIEESSVGAEAAVAKLGKGGMAALKRAFDDFSKGGSVSTFGNALDEIIRKTGATEGEIKAALGKITSEMENAGPKAQAAGGLVGDRFVAGLIRGLASAVLSGALLSQIVEVAKNLVNVQELAERAGISVREMQETLYAASKGGVSQVQAVKDLEKFGQLLNDAEREANGLFKLFEANKLKTADFAGNFQGALAEVARLVQNARTEFDKIRIVELAGLSKEWVGILQQGPEAMAEIARQAQAAGAVLDDLAFKKAQEFKTAWDDATTRWAALMREAVVTILPLLDSLISKALQLPTLIGQFGRLVKGISMSDLGGFNRVPEVMNLQELESTVKMMEAIANRPDAKPSPTFLNNLQLMKDRIDSLRLSAEAAGEEVSRLPRIVINGPAGNRTTNVPNRSNPGSGPKSNALDSAEDAILKRIALLEAEATTIGKTTFERDKARASAELMTAAEKAGIPITAAVIEDIDRLSTSYANAADRVRQLKDRWESANALAREFGNAAINSFEGIISGTKTVNQALAETLRMLARMIAQAALLGEGPLAGLMGTKSAGSGVGGLLGSGLSAIWGGFRSGGGDVQRGKAYKVGELGSETFIPGADGKIVPHRGGTSAEAAPAVVMHNDFRDANASVVPMLMGRIARLERAMPNLIPSTVRESRRLAPFSTG